MDGNPRNAVADAHIFPTEKGILAHVDGYGLSQLPGEAVPVLLYHPNPVGRV